MVVLLCNRCAHHADLFMDPTAANQRPDKFCFLCTASRQTPHCCFVLCVCLLLTSLVWSADSGVPLLAGILAAPSGSLIPSGAAALPSDGAGTQQQQASQPPMRILEGPSTNPEPPPEGLSPPMARELDSNMDSEAGEGALPPALYGLPSELREPPPGQC
jgi:hypothetical protein